MRAEAYPEEDPLTLPTPEQITPIFVHLASARVQRMSLARCWRHKTGQSRLN